MTQQKQSLLDRIMKWAQLISVTGAIIAGSVHYLSTFTKYRDVANSSAYRVERVERYLAAKDPQYWQTAESLIRPGEPDVYQVKSPKALAHTFDSLKQYDGVAADTAPAVPANPKGKP
jgi:hypothetical protein